MIAFLATATLLWPQAALVDSVFLQKAASSGQAEAAAGKLATAEASNPEVKALAERVVEDYTKFNLVVNELARIKSVPLDPNAAVLTDDLGLLKGPEFDRAFLVRMVRTREQTIRDFEAHGKTTKDPDISGFVQAVLPVLRGHLEQARSLRP